MDNARVTNTGKGFLQGSSIYNIAYTGWEFTRDKPFYIYPNTAWIIYIDADNGDKNVPIKVNAWQTPPITITKIYETWSTVLVADIKIIY